MKLVNIFKSAAQRYGTERRVILLHGPVGLLPFCMIQRRKVWT
jgi:hypothetical protein